MVSDEIGKKLHDKASRGKTLTIEEQTQLTAWYTSQDEAEANFLSPLANKVDLEALQRQVDTASNQLTAVTERIQQVTVENKSLRQEITNLQQQLASRKQPI